MNNDWYKCSDAERELIESRAPDEVCILFGPHGVQKLTVDQWELIYMKGYAEAMRTAAAQAGIKITPKGKGFVLSAAEILSDDWNMEASTVTVRLRGQDRRIGSGVAFLRPPGLQ
jgi:hypothetical protein